MKLKNNKHFQWGMTAFLVIAASLLFYYLLFHSTSIKENLNNSLNVLLPIILGFSMAYLMTPILNNIEHRILFPLCKKLKIKNSNKRTKIIRVISIVLTVFLFYAIIYSLIAMLVSQIVPSVSNIIVNFDIYINNFIKWLNKLLSDDYPEIGTSVIKLINSLSGDFEIWLNENVLAKTSELIKTVSLSVINVLGFLWDFILGFIISVYVLASKDKFSGQAKKLSYALFNTETANIVINNFRFTHRTFIGFLSGKILVSIIVGLLCYVGTSLLQTPYAALISVVIGVTNIIPYLGPYLGGIPCTILVFVVDPAHPLNAVYFAIFILILQQLDGNVLEPKIVGDSTGLAGFWVIISIILFGGLFGVFGMIIGVPVFAVIYAAVKSILNTLLKNKNMPVDTETYTNVAAIKGNTLYEYIPEYKLKKKEKDTVVFGKEFICRVDSKKMKTYDNVNASDLVDDNDNVDEKKDFSTVQDKNENQ